MSIKRIGSIIFPSSFLVVIAIIGFLIHGLSLKHVHGQAQISNQPQTRLASTSISVGQVLGSAVCPIGVSTQELCVQPSVGTTGAAGVAIQSGNTGARVLVMMTGVVECLFDNQPVLNDLAFNNTGNCHDSGITLLSQAANTQGVIGKVIGLVDSTHAWVTMYRPGSVGDLVVSGSLDSSTIPAYIKANQTAQVNSDWNASSGSALIVNKPTLSVVATSGSYTDLTSKPTIPAAQVNSDWNSTSGLSQILNKPPLTQYYLNGTLITQTVKDLTYTGTTASNGTATINISALSCTQLVGLPTVDCQSGSLCTPQSSSSSVSSVAVLTNGGTTVSIVGINIVSLASSAIAYSMKLKCY